MFPIADSGKAPEQICRPLLSRHGAVLDRYRVSHRDDALYTAGTRHRAEAERDRIRAEHESGANAIADVCRRPTVSGRGLISFP